ncbi:hypothetical protein PVK06_048037 [Gossypium arboreum]|uniref:Uncharacterized protein n=1 Tax=Gossypium arboreum TaxID=29729 RepID=A0ABR0MEZ4_GOSAR|nr:hypothetical protein PVK06_048037 [Gossypium arboreum]
MVAKEQRAQRWHKKNIAAAGEGHTATRGVVHIDVNKPGSSSSTSQESLELPKEPMTRARARQFQEVVSALITQFWEENKLDVNGKARTNFLKNPCTFVQVELNSFPAL